MNVTVPATWVASGHLPAVCARHGTPSTHLVARKFYSRTPIWVWLLAPLSLLVAAIVAIAIRATVAGGLPGCERCTAERRRFVAAAFGGWAASLAALVGAVWASSGALAVVWAVATGAALVFSFSGEFFRARGGVLKDRRWVELVGTHRAFADPVRAAVQGVSGATAGLVGAGGSPSRAGSASATVLPGG